MILAANLEVWCCFNVTGFNKLDIRNYVSIALRLHYRYIYPKLALTGKWDMMCSVLGGYK